MKKFILLIMSLCFVFASCRVSVLGSSEYRKYEDLEKKLQPEQKKNWTVLVYMCGDNNLANEIISDINEMESSDFNKANVNILALADVSRSAGLEFDGTKLFCVKNDNTNSPKIVSEEIDLEYLNLPEYSTSLDMADEDVLSSFIEFSRDFFPADHYALVVWGHGSGWRCPEESSASRAIAFDDGSKSFMSMPEFRSSLENSLGGKKLDLIYFDTCFGSELEVVYELKDVCSWFAGSEGLVKATGSDYKEWFSSCSFEEETGNELAQPLLAQTNDFSIFDMSYAGSVFDKFDALCLSCSNLIVKQGQRRSVLEGIQSSVITYFINGTVSDVYMDVFQFSSLLANIFPELVDKALDLQRTLESAVGVFPEALSDIKPSVGVYFCSVDSTNTIIKNYSEYYIKNSGAKNQTQFVKKSVGYVPSKNNAGTFLDKIIVEN